jgi:hypothetical protein
VKTVRIVHGSYAGWQAHRRLGEQPCPDCTRAMVDYAAMWRFRTGQHRHPRVCRECGSVFPTHLCGGAGT